MGTQNRGNMKEMAAPQMYLLALILIYITVVQVECEGLSYTCVSTNNNLHHECDIHADDHNCNFNLNLNLCKRVQDWSITLKMDDTFIPGGGDYKGEKVLMTSPIGK